MKNVHEVISERCGDDWISVKDTAIILDAIGREIETLVRKKINSDILKIHQLSGYIRNNNKDSAEDVAQSVIALLWKVSGRLHYLNSIYNSGDEDMKQIISDADNCLTHLRTFLMDAYINKSYVKATEAFECETDK